MPEEAPSLVRQAIGLTVAAAGQELQGFRRQVPDLMLKSVQIDRIGCAGGANDRIGPEAEFSRGCNKAATPVSDFKPSASGRSRAASGFVLGQQTRARPGQREYRARWPPAPGGVPGFVIPPDQIGA